MTCQFGLMNSFATGVPACERRYTRGYRLHAVLVMSDDGNLRRLHTRAKERRPAGGASNGDLRRAKSASQPFDGVGRERARHVSPPTTDNPMRPTHRPSGRGIGTTPPSPSTNETDIA